MFRRMLLIMSSLIGTALSCQDTCLPGFCNQDNYCEKCQDGYYIVPVEPGLDWGFCSQCSEGCNTCTDGLHCLDCQEGRAQGSDTCPLCDGNCVFCEYTPTQCTTCRADYVLDDNQHCYYRYTLVVGLVVGGATLVCLLVVSCLINIFLKKREIKAFKGSVLDESAMKNTYFVNHVQKIGRNDDDDNDISQVKDNAKSSEDFITRKTADLFLSEIKERLESHP